MALKYVYEKVRDKIRKEIMQYRNCDEEIWFWESKYADDLGVSRMTVRKAVEELVNEGLIIRVPGKGITIRKAKNNGMDLSHRLAFLIKHDPYDDYFSKTITGCIGCANENEYYYTIYNFDSFSDQKTYIEKIIQNNIDGIILSVFPENEIEYLKLFEDLSNRNIPFILIDNVFDDAVDRFPYVVSDDVAGGYTAAKYLIEHGHKKIAFFYDRLDVHSIKLRYQGYRKALEENGIKFKDYFLFNSEEPNLAERLFFLVEKQGITAATTYSDKCISKIYHELIALGYKIPEDMSLVGYGNLLISRVLETPLTTIEVPVFEIGKTACEILIRYLEGDGQLSNKIFDIKLLERNSVLPK
ncbi:MAG: LacI family DNA-binding transcriptional regulator [Spirochaetia bacterium]